MTKKELIQIISSQSDRYGDKLIDFMDSYGLTNLKDTKVEQLEEYVNLNCQSEEMQLGE